MIPDAALKRAQEAISDLELFAESADEDWARRKAEDFARTRRALVFPLPSASPADLIRWFVGRWSTMLDGLDALKEWDRNYALHCHCEHPAFGREKLSWFRVLGSGADTFEIANLADGYVVLRHRQFPDGPALKIPAGEWEIFRYGIQSEHFVVDGESE